MQYAHRQNSSFRKLNNFTVYFYQTLRQISGKFQNETMQIWGEVSHILAVLSGVLTPPNKRVHRGGERR